MRLFDGDRLLIATHNAGKLAEFCAILAPLGITCVGAGVLNLPEPEETGATFAENALIKARAAAQASGLPALADDSGLCVAALGLAPGVQTARWCGPARDAVVGMTRVAEALAAATSENRAAFFICALVLAWPDGRSVSVEGRCDGHIVWPPRGMGGHGFDPCFVPEGEPLTFAEMRPEAKQQISHRARAMKKLCELLTEA